MNLFNDKDFSDWILRVEIDIVSDSLDSKSDSVIVVESDDDCDMDSKSNNNSKKRQKRENLEEKERNQRRRKMSRPKLQKASSTNLNNDNVKTLHISSAMLAAKIPFFLKLFKNGMRESQEKVVTLRINPSEEAALMDLLKFMYSNTLSATSATELVAVLIVADKFEVSSCMSYCSELLKKMPMSLEFALLFLELPSSALQCVVLEPILDASKKYVVERFEDAFDDTQPQEEAMTLPLSAIEVLLGSDDLQVGFEEQVYRFILRWGRARYPKQKERREILTKLLGWFVHFPFLSVYVLEEIQECPDFDGKEVSKMILKFLYLNAGYPYALYTANRFYEYLPIKEVQFESRRVVYLTLKRAGFLYLSSERECSQPLDNGKGSH